MGYAVYFDHSTHRWAGYGVPAECDWPDCSEEIDRGLGFKCEDHGHFVLELDGEQIDYARFDDEPDAEEVWEEVEGCGWFLCSEHRDRREVYDHNTITEGKPDSAEWIEHMRTDESWEKWREENPDHPYLTEQDSLPQA